jgi:hypothetical protein
MPAAHPPLSRGWLRRQANGPRESQRREPGEKGLGKRSTHGHSSERWIREFELAADVLSLDISYPMNSRGAAKFAIGSDPKSEMTPERPRDIVASRPIEQGAPKRGSDDRIPVNPTRLDPRNNFKFRLNWEGQYVAGVSRVSALRRVTEVVEHRDGGDPSISRKSPGLTQFDAITLERRVA